MCQRWTLPPFRMMTKVQMHKEEGGRKHHCPVKGHPQARGVSTQAVAPAEGFLVSAEYTEQSMPGRPTSCW